METTTSTSDATPTSTLEMKSPARSGRAAGQEAIEMDNHHDDNRSTDAERDGKLEEGVAQARLARDLATAFDRFARSLEVSPRAARAVPPHTRLIHRTGRDRGTPCAGEEAMTRRAPGLGTIERLRNGRYRARLCDGRDRPSLGVVATSDEAERLIAAANKVRAEAPATEPTRTTGGGPTFDDLGREWTSGRLQKKHPAHLRRKATAEDDAKQLTVLRPSIGHIPLRDFRTEDADEALRRLSERVGQTTLRRYAQVIHRVLRLAVYPAQIIERTPLPSGWLPRNADARAKSYLYPSEDKMLMACKRVPLARRVLYGVLAREGLRTGEALSLGWEHLDLNNGVIRLDANKTNDPRSWSLGRDVLRALTEWRKRNTSALVFDGLATDRGDLAITFRADLRAAGVVRPDLFEHGDTRIAIRCHDLRASFVTIALAVGKSEAWVTGRTGHKSSQMLRLYQRQAQTAQELGFTWFEPLDQVIQFDGAPPTSTPTSTPIETESTSSPIDAMLQGGLSGTRTRDLRIKSPQLYRLSYQPDEDESDASTTTGLLTSGRASI